MPLNPQHKGILSPTTIFNSAVSFMTNTNLQHYSGDQHLSNFSQIFFCIPNFFLSAAVGLCALTAIIRLFRGAKKIGSFFVDMWRVVVYIFLPVAFLLSLVFVQQGMPMTYRSSYQVSTFGKLPVNLPAVAGLPVDQHLGNLEGKEMRFGTSAGATFATVTVDVTCGAVNAEHDSLNPLASLSPLVGMWLNCIFGGKGVGMINLLLFLVIGIFIAGMMVGRTPEYLGKKLGGREMKLAMIALLVHPIMILMPTGLFAAANWGLKATSNPGPHGFSQMVYQFSSASANNGSAFAGGANVAFHIGDR
jgi:K+-transporting ATPase A subunit